MLDDLRRELELHRSSGFPRDVEPGRTYGAARAVLIDADIYGWCSRVGRGESLSDIDVQRLLEATATLVASILALPWSARPYFTRLVLIASLALAISGDPDDDGTPALDPSA
ncbi:hypothetical protein ACFJGV_10385 [Cnuibacter sp. UC19_7]|uniref:hypothetical protein n=1 Tax=Cnuibacter sp. UC19_7 TaxID=3350166 RepID=UPI00366D03BC